MLEPIPCTMLRPFGFHASANVEPLNQNQPKNAMNPTGRITPHTVTEPRRPVSLGPPKFAMDVSHRRPITPAQVAPGVAVSAGKKPAR
jgi:hypothetical protein